MFALNVTDLESSGYAEEFNGTIDEQTRQNKRETDRTSPSLISTGMLVMYNRVSSSVTIILPTDDSQAESAVPRRRLHYFPPSMWKMWCMSLLWGRLARPFETWRGSFEAPPSWLNQFSDDWRILLALFDPSVVTTRDDVVTPVDSAPSCEYHEPALSRRLLASPSLVTALWSACVWEGVASTTRLSFCTFALSPFPAAAAVSYLYHWLELQTGLIKWARLASLSAFAGGEAGWSSTLTGAAAGWWLGEVLCWGANQSLPARFLAAYDFASSIFL